MTPKQPQQIIDVETTVETTRNPKDVVDSLMPYLLDELVRKVEETYMKNNSILHLNVKHNPNGKKVITLGFKLLPSF